MALFARLAVPFLHQQCLVAWRKVSEAVSKHFHCQRFFSSTAGLIFRGVVQSNTFIVRFLLSNQGQYISTADFSLLLFVRASEALQYARDFLFGMLQFSWRWCLEKACFRSGRGQAKYCWQHARRERLFTWLGLLSIAAQFAGVGTSNVFICCLTYRRQGVFARFFQANFQLKQANKCLVVSLLCVCILIVYSGGWTCSKQWLLEVSFDFIVLFFRQFSCSSTACNNS